MAKTLGIVQARLGSTRLRGKMARKLGGKSLLEWVVRRVSDCQHLDQLIVAAGDGPEDHRIAELVPSDIPVFFGSEQDVLGRFAAAIQQFQADAVVRVCADNPFIDPDLIDRLIATAEKHPQCDYISYCSRNGHPVILSSVGVYAEWCRASAIVRAAQETRDVFDREHVTRFLYSHPEQFRIRLIPAPHELDRDDLRLTVDSEEDWEHAEAIVEALGHEALDWQRITELLDHQPQLRERMAHLNRAHCKA
jgi:spore coat polysaccharide biosynthesis protein SpsF